MVYLRDADTLIAPRVAATLKALTLTEKDDAAAKLAEQYAHLIDDSADDPKLYAWSLRWIGPLLLQCLESLGATPMARNAMKDKVPAREPSGQLAKLRSVSGSI